MQLCAPAHTRQPPAQRSAPTDPAYAAARSSSSAYAASADSTSFFAASKTARRTPAHADSSSAKSGCDRLQRPGSTNQKWTAAQLCTVLHTQYAVCTYHHIIEYMCKEQYS